MPYTPPSAQSPASSKSNSPVVSRKSSYHEDLPRAPVMAAARPQPPRSMSSASYLHKHRRSPSISKPDGILPKTNGVPESRSVDVADFASMGSIRQSPPPINNLRMPTGAVISPPDSSENSDGDEKSQHQRGRELEKNWNELQMAVRSLPQQRESSPDKLHTPLSQPQPTSEPVSQVVSPTALSTEARKISHSRSSTETKLMIRPPTYSDSPVQTSDDSEDEDGPFVKPSLVRKKSGELVKPALRPSSRRRYSSMPGTPTYHKSVHFNDSDNQTRHFLQVDKPIAVSAGTSPVEQYDSESEFPFDSDGKPVVELGIKIANFPTDTFERRTKPICVERIFLSGDKNMLVGTCSVQNIAFQKLVVARFTLDYWKTTSEVVAEYNNDVRNPTTDGCDRFNFHIKLSDQANISNKTMLLCVRYNVGGQVFWDNNEGMNYHIDFTKIETKPAGKPVKPAPSHSLGQRPLHAIPRSRHSPPVSRHGSKHGSLDDDFAHRFDVDSAYSLESHDSLLGESPTTTIRLKPKTKRSPMFATGPTSPPTNGLGSRYDFGTSLSAALSNAQDKLGRQSGLMNATARPQATGSYFGVVDRTVPAKPDVKTDRPDALSTDRPAMGSDQYRDLVQKFCYFTSGSGKGSSLVTTTDNNPGAASPPHTDGVSDAGSSSSSCSSSSSSDSSASASPLLDGANDRSALSPFLSRSGSPSPGTHLGARSASPARFGYPYHSSFRDGYLSDTPTPTAIHG